VTTSTSPGWSLSATLRSSVRSLRAPKAFSEYGELLFRVQDESLMEGMPLVISGEENEHDLRPASRRDSRFELNADPVEPAPPRNATPAIAIHLQIEFVRETVGVAHKEQPSSR
jgi:hypothetical protein